MKIRKFSRAAAVAASFAFACAGMSASAAEGDDEGSAAREDTATQERSAQEGKAGASSTFTARVPILVMVPMEFKVDREAKGCWVEMYSKDDFQGVALTLVGPLDMATMSGPFGFDWENEIESIKTGPRATIRIYDNENFKEHSEWVGPSKEVKDLDDRMELFDSFRSMKVDC